MKIILQLSLLLLIGFLAFNLQACDRRQELYILNWDEYIDYDLVDKFEKEYNCDVILNIAQSNETMFTKIAGDAAPYDLVFPSDYMISQMVNYKELGKAKPLIKPIDFTKLENYSEESFDSNLISLINKDCYEIKDYFVPYFWGSLGIMYNTKKLSSEQIELIHQYGYDVLFDSSILGKKVKIGMYASARDSVASALIHKGYSLNTKNKEELKEAKIVLDEMDYFKWDTDDLKTDVANGILDIALVYSGDFFDMLYSSYSSVDDGEEPIINYNMYSPQDHNNVFFDGMCIPITSRSTDLAYKFIDFMIKHENALTNASYVGYCPTLSSVYNEILYDPEFEGIADLEPYYPGSIANGEVYQYLGIDIYKYYDKIYQAVKD